jgi:hypothetical protein
MLESEAATTRNGSSAIARSMSEVDRRICQCRRTDKDEKSAFPGWPGRKPVTGKPVFRELAVPVPNWGFLGNPVVLRLVVY